MHNSKLIVSHLAKELSTYIPNEQRYKSPQQNTSKPNPEHTEIVILYNQMRIQDEIQRGFNIY